MPRVAFIDQTGAESGGAQESLALLLRYLPPEIDPFVLVYHDGAFAQRLRAQGLSVEHFPVAGSFDAGKREGVSLGAIAAVPSIAARLARRVAQARTDVVYTHTIKGHFAGGPAARLAGIPCVMHFRDILEGRARTALRAIAATCSSSRIAISQTVASAYHLPKTNVIFNPIDLEAYARLPDRAQACERLGIPYDPQTVTVGILGRINRWKGHDRFLRIAAQVRGKMRARFLIVGSAVFRDTDFVGELHALARDLGIEEDVHFIPWLDDVRYAYAAMDVHCNCSEREPFGRSALEAAAAGVPTVCFADSGMSEVLSGTPHARVVPARDEAAFAQGVCDLAGRPERERMQFELRQLAGEFAPALHAERVAAVLEGAIA